MNTTRMMTVKLLVSLLVVACLSGIISLAGCEQFQAPAATHTPTPTATPTPTPTPVEPFMVYSHPELSGILAFAAGPAGLPYASHIYVMNADGSVLARLTDKQANYFKLNWSPDGKQIALSKLSWSPDGKQITLNSYLQLYVMNADGSGEKILPMKINNNYPISWEPDGRNIRFIIYDTSGERRITYTVKADASEPAKMVETGNNKYLGPHCFYYWSPDRKKIVAYGCFIIPFKTGILYIMNADGTKVIEVSVRTHLLSGDSLVTWSPDSQKIGYYFRDIESGAPFGIYIMNADGSEQTLVYEGEVDQFAWSPDGMQIAFTHECQINVIDIDGSNLVTLADGCIGRKSYEDIYFHAISWTR